MNISAIENTKTDLIHGYRAVNGGEKILQNGLNLNNSNMYNRIYARLVNSNLSATLRQPAKPAYLITQINYLGLKKIDSLSICGHKVKFTNDVWDFTEEYKEGRSKADYCYHMVGISKNMKTNELYNIILKLFTFYLLTDKGVQATGNHNVFAYIRTFLNELYKKNIYDIRIVTPVILKSIIEKDSRLYSTQTKMKGSLAYFYSFYSFVVENIYTKEIAKYLETIDRNIINAT